MTAEEQVEKWFEDFRSENPMYKNEFVSNNQILFWLAEKQSKESENDNLLLAENCEHHQHDHCTCVGKYCMYGK